MSDVIIRNYNGDQTQIFRKVVENCFVSKIKAGMPIIIGVVGKSSHGKSWFVLLIQQIIYDLIGEDFAKYVSTCVLIKPNDYAQHVKTILYDNKFKNICTVQMDEARFLLNAAKWQSFKNQATRDITAISRSRKPLIFFILAQRRKNIDPQTRETLDFYIKVSRTPGEIPEAEIWELYETEDNYENPVIKKSPIVVTVISKSGTKQTIIPKFRPQKPRQDIIDLYEDLSTKAKDEEILGILSRMEDETAKLTKESESAVEEYISFLKSHPEEAQKIGKMKRGKWVLDKEAIKRLGYSPSQRKDIEYEMTKSIINFEEEKEESTETTQESGQNGEQSVLSTVEK